MSKLLWKKNVKTTARESAASDHTRVNDSSLPETPSLDGYAISELRIEQLAHVLRLDELRPEQVAQLVSALTRPGKSGGP
jgi:hypothetical protein